MNVTEEVRHIVADTLNLPLASINESSSAATLDAWDSMAQVNLMMAVEQHFNVELEVEDFMKLNSVKALIDFFSD